VTALKRLLRPLGAPLRRLLDGRFADVNRRLGDVRAAVAYQEGELAKLMHEVAAHTATQNEALSYTAVSLRRMEDTLHARQERILVELQRLDQQAYEQRLEHVSQGPLDKLDGPLAAAINVASGHEGFAAQAGLWFNPAVTVELTEGNAAISDVNERIVELPFALGQLARLEPPARILDIGGAESTLALSAAALGYSVTVLDPQGVPYEHPNIAGFSCRLEEWEADGQEPFAAVFLISAIEHFGLGAYGEQAGGAQADRDALVRVRELLAEDGLLVLTTPYGEASISEFERIYDDAALERLLDGWEIVERRTIVRTDRRTWLPGTEGTGAAVLIAATPMPRS
jgi:2-polyprenyl-3-methyl-5-hydroxy-6-metoxy-1,4-benzoquinol methylase